MIKKLLFLFLSLLLLLPSLPITASSHEPPSGEEAESMLLYCFHTDSVLTEKNASLPFATGNTAQLMTVLLALETYPDLTTEVTLTEDLLPGWYAPGDYRTLADYGFLKNKTLPVKDLIATTVIENANCSSLLLASLIAGTRAEFVARMNARAKELGMQNTVYKNPTGDDAEGAVTTANDLMILSKLLYQNPDFMTLASAKSYKMLSSDFRIYTRNYFIGEWYTDAYLYERASGMKAGYTENSGNTLVATATESDGYSYLAIVLGGKERNFLNTSYALARSLFRWGSTAFSYREVLSSAKLITTLPVNGGDGLSRVSLFPKESLNAYLPKAISEEDIRVEYTLVREALDAPFEKNTAVGEIKVYYRDTVVGETELVTGNGAKKAQNATLSDRLSGLVKPILLIGGGLLVILAFRVILIKKKKSPKT